VILHFGLGLDPKRREVRVALAKEISLVQAQGDALIAR